MGKKFDLTFTVLGKPEPAGSKKGFYNQRMRRVIITDANKESRGWKNQVAELAHQAMAGRKPFSGPLEVTFMFFVQRPQGHYGKGKNAEKVKASSPVYPTVKPDVLKLARGVEDAMTSIVYRDDSLIVEEHISKLYGEPERVEVYVRVLDSDS